MLCRRATHSIHFRKGIEQNKNIRTSFQCTILIGCLSCGEALPVLSPVIQTLCNNSQKLLVSPKLEIIDHDHTFVHFSNEELDRHSLYDEGGHYYLEASRLFALFALLLNLHLFHYNKV
jgi:hypothetical protein